MNRKYYIKIDLLNFPVLCTIHVFCNQNILMFRFNACCGAIVFTSVCGGLLIIMYFKAPITCKRNCTSLNSRKAINFRKVLILSFE